MSEQSTEKAPTHVLGDRPRRKSGDGPTHGIASTYRNSVYACRCQPCKDANAALQCIEGELRAERLAADPTVVRHGLKSTYVNWRCRCEACKAAHGESLKAASLRRRERLKDDPTIVQHGRNATYDGWGCRCDPCKEAHAEVRAARRSRVVTPPAKGDDDA